VNKPFARGADFSGIGIHEDLYINAIMQKTCIDLNEKGLEDAVGAKTGELAVFGCGVVQEVL
jgi:serine protease inhibitor